MKIRRRKLENNVTFVSGYPALLQRIYAARGVETASALDKRLQALESFTSLTHIERACRRLETALNEQQRILIIGDFDADGATSTALAVSALKRFGAKQIDFLVPNRFEYGYGLSPEIVTVAAEEKKPNLIITVDNGISSIEGVAHAKTLGIDVIITDHHLPAETLPDACAIVNPNQFGDDFPSKSIAGVGVIFYVMVALRRHLITQNWFETSQIEAPNMAQFLDLVALGTIADVVALDQNNRILVSQGLARMRQGLCRLGIQALAKVSGKELSQLRESDLGFSIAPRLNAAGRLDDMSEGIHCLLSDDETESLRLATKLDSLNKERRKIENEMKAQALDAIEAITRTVDSHKTALPIALCLVDDAWHQGVIGILAGRLKERFSRPTIVFAAVNETELKGSARSIAALNIRNVLAAVDKDNPGLITKFGGHAMAAGLSLEPANFEAFKAAFTAEVGQQIDVSQCEGEILSDGALAVNELTLETSRLISEAGPWGQAFPEPVFDDLFEILEQRLVGQHHLKLTLMHRDGGEPIDAIAFNVDLKKWPNHRINQVHLAYRLDINTFRGRSKLQLIVQTLMYSEALEIV